MKAGDRVIYEQHPGTILEVCDTEFLHRHFTQIEVKTDPSYLVKLDNGPRIWTKSISRLIEL